MSERIRENLCTIGAACIGYAIGACLVCLPQLSGCKAPVDIDAPVSVPVMADVDVPVASQPQDGEQTGSGNTLVQIGGGTGAVLAIGLIGLVGWRLRNRALTAQQAVDRLINMIERADVPQVKKAVHLVGLRHGVPDPVECVIEKRVRAVTK